VLNEPTHPWAGGTRAVRARHVPEPIARWILEWYDANAFMRADGNVRCEKCGREYRDHPEILSTFVLLCDGQIGKL
jgi:hypothetical protein